MRLLLGFVLMLIGGGIMLFGIVLALRQLLGLYQGVLDDPLGQPAGAEEAVQQGMFRGVAIGAVGVVPFIAGVVLFKGGMTRRRHRRFRP